QSQSITQKPVFKENLTAPIKKGKSLGVIEIYSGDTQIGAIDIVASETVKKMRFSTALLWLLKGLVEI
ncbi:MAG: D-alanyl-D-alanine carboxypeptidase, partial [Clostridia bacterium]|nr:D-alanyl-D-alanine carboxypeptidase [Clostridia bacterium]